MAFTASWQFAQMTIATTYTGMMIEAPNPSNKFKDQPHVATAKLLAFLVKVYRRQ